MCFVCCIFFIMLYFNSFSKMLCIVCILFSLCFCIVYFVNYFSPIIIVWIILAHEVSVVYFTLMSIVWLGKGKFVFTGFWSHVCMVVNCGLMPRLIHAGAFKLSWSRNQLIKIHSFECVRNGYEQIISQDNTSDF